MYEPYELVNLVDAGELTKPDDFEGQFPMRGSALGKCARALTHLMAGHPKEDVDARRRRIFEVGHQRGEALGEALSRGLTLKHGPNGTGDVEWHEEFRVKIPMPFTPEEGKDIYDTALEWVEGDTDKLPMHYNVQTGRFCLLGSLDFLVLNKVTKEAVVIDWKTKHSFGFRRLSDEGIDMGYLVQVGGYVEGLIEMGIPRDRIRAFVYYECKDDQKHRPLELEVNDAFVCENVESMIEEKAEALRLWRFGSHAPAGYEPNEKGKLPWNCNYCDVGPVAGGCFKGTLTDDRRGGADVPSWTVHPDG